MIKLEYVSPELEVTELETEGFLCGSDMVDDDTTNPVEKIDNPDDSDFDW
jgi:hypothetical protein